MESSLLSLCIPTNSWALVLKGNHHHNIGQISLATLWPRSTGYQELVFIFHRLTAEQRVGGKSPQQQFSRMLCRLQG